MHPTAIEKVKDEDNQLAQSFSKFMRQGKVKSALRLLSKCEGMVLDVDTLVTNDGNEDRTVLDELKDKHPDKAQISLEAITEDEGKEFHPVIIYSIDGQAIQQAALKTNGAAGPSDLDARAWKRMCTAFKHHSSSLCNSLALVTKKLSTRYVNPNPVGITAFTSSRLIAIDKQPRVRPIAIGEVPRRIISKAILSVVRPDVLEVAGSVQLCADSGINFATSGRKHLGQHWAMQYSQKSTSRPKLSSGKRSLRHCAW